MSTSNPPRIISGEQYEFFHPGKVEASSKDRAWEGLLFNQYTHPKKFDGSPRPATNDHILAFGCNGAVKGENSVNSDKWQPYEWREKEFFLGPAYANDRDARWQTMSNDEELQVAYIHLSPVLLSKNAQRSTGGNSEYIELSPKLGFKDMFMYELGMQLKSELEHSNPFGQLYVETAANLLAVHLLRHYSAFDHNIEYNLKANRNLVLVQRVRDYIQDHLDEELSLESMAELVAMSCYHFAHLFKNVTGLAPHQYVVAERMKKAKRLLKTTGLSIAQISIEVGYTPAHFGKIFKRFNDVTPVTFRNKS